MSSPAALHRLARSGLGSTLRPPPIAAVCLSRNFRAASRPSPSFCRCAAGRPAANSCRCCGLRSMAATGSSRRWRAATIRPSRSSPAEQAAEPGAPLDGRRRGAGGRRRAEGLEPACGARSADGGGRDRRLHRRRHAATPLSASAARRRSRQFRTAGGDRLPLDDSRRTLAQAPCALAAANNSIAARCRAARCPCRSSGAAASRCGGRRWTRSGFAISGAARSATTCRWPRPCARPACSPTPRVRAS